VDEHDSERKIQLDLAGRPDLGSHRVNHEINYQASQQGLQQGFPAVSGGVEYAVATFVKKVLDFVFPEKEGCVLCGRLGDSRYSKEVFFALICGDCLSRIPFVQEPICDICGRPLRGRAVDTSEQECRTGTRDASEHDRQRGAGNRGFLKPQESLDHGVVTSGAKRVASGAPGPSGAPGLSGALRRSDTSGKMLCTDCKSRGRFFMRARTFGTYDGVLKELIREFKFHGRRDLAEGLGVLMAREVSRDVSMRRCDIIVPVPLHPIRLAERGYNQAELLAKEVGFCFGIRVENCIERLIRPGEQSRLGRQLRKDHIRGAFTVAYPAKVAGKRVLLVDDVITTGNTANECARVLLRAGAAEVYVIAAAISPYEPEWIIH
jgi:ComF family protein